MNKNFRLLYLSFALPPGLRALHPDINPAGNSFEEGQMVGALRGHFDFRSVGQMPFPIGELPANADPASGVAPRSVMLVEQAPELWHRIVSLRRS